MACIEGGGTCFIFILIIIFMNGVNVLRIDEFSLKKMDIKNGFYGPADFFARYT